MIRILFPFAVRLFLSFLAAKFLLGLLGVGSPRALLLLSLALVGNIYLFDLLDRYYEGAWRRALSPRELGWRAARLSVWLNRVRRRRESPEAPRPPEAGASGK
ncbi:MAG: hypothetical protein K6T55_02425 [Syntrophobacterales bacterium]|nr:hypothetical protein [Syntrophobacterales bacterium]